MRSGEAKDSFKAAVLKTLARTSSNTVPPSTSTPIRTSNTGVPASQTSLPESRTQPSTPLDPSNASVTSDQPTMTSQNNTPEIAAGAATIHANESTAPQSASSNQSSQTIQNLLADRR